MNQVKTNVMRLLDAAGIAHVDYQYDVSDGHLDAVSIARKIGRPEEQVFKTLVTVSSTREYFVFVIPGGCELDLKKAALASAQKSIDMIPQKTLFPLTGYLHGGCSPVGMKKPFRTFIDETAILYDDICVSGGRVGTNVQVDPQALAAYINAEFVDLVRS